ncbi:hypothetical protein FDP41_001739 [Naegleria fowleri]|uniref:Uncharacterized protein n=1 Tax=Naegleria fowleri TaxID=5763 RepID=A0A6A5BVS9_NAEFO|nr:uncharacterized protein FDP41_001739 [Naegleria fowleri]KAF0979396.1 hypothetical protein FDP41_001739 [Naegleria fowleri]
MSTTSYIDINALLGSSSDPQTYRWSYSAPLGSASSSTTTTAATITTMSVAGTSSSSSAVSNSYGSMALKTTEQLFESSTSYKTPSYHHANENNNIQTKPQPVNHNTLNGGDDHQTNNNNNNNQKLISSSAHDASQPTTTTTSNEMDNDSKSVIMDEEDDDDVVYLGYQHPHTNDDDDEDEDISNNVDATPRNTKRRTFRHSEPVKSARFTSPSTSRAHRNIQTPSPRLSSHEEDSETGESESEEEENSIITDTPSICSERDLSPPKKNRKTKGRKRDLEEVREKLKKYSKRVKNDERQVTQNGVTAQQFIVPHVTPSDNNSQQLPSSILQHVAPPGPQILQVPPLAQQPSASNDGQTAEQAFSAKQEITKKLVDSYGEERLIPDIVNFVTVMQKMNPEDMTCVLKRIIEENNGNFLDTRNAYYYLLCEIKECIPSKRAKVQKTWNRRKDETKKNNRNWKLLLEQYPKLSNYDISSKLSPLQIRDVIDKYPALQDKFK